MKDGKFSNEKKSVCFCLNLLPICILVRLKSSSIQRDHAVVLEVAGSVPNTIITVLMTVSLTIDIWRIFQTNSPVYYATCSGASLFWLSSRVWPTWHCAHGCPSSSCAARQLTVVHPLLITILLFVPVPIYLSTLGFLRLVSKSSIHLRSSC